MIRTYRQERNRPIKLQLTVVQPCPQGWTLDKFQLSAQGIESYQFVVGKLITEPQSVSALVSYVKLCRPLCHY